MEKFCYLAGTIGAREGSIESALARVRNRWSKVRDLLHLLSKKDFPTGTQGGLYSTCVRTSFILHSTLLTL